jgi:membrane associated rhomboid family serine protease
MGLLDRDYYRDEEGGPIANWFRHGLVTKILFAINCLAFILQIVTIPRRGGPGPFTEFLALNGDRLLHGEAWRLITYCFLHPTDSLFPFLFNMPLLWVAGHALEERLGRERFLAFYLGSAVLGGLAMAGAVFLGLRGVASDTTYIVSCAAPLTALLAFLTLQSPRERLTFFHALSVPVWVLLALAIGTDVLGLLLSLVWPSVLGAEGRRVTLAGHFGGLMAAMIFQALMQSTRGFRGRRRAVTPLSDPDLHIYRDETPSHEEDDEEEMPAPIGPKSDVDEHLEAQLDAVLAKVAAHGQQSLTSAEREILNRASEVYRKRRR